MEVSRGKDTGDLDIYVFVVLDSGTKVTARSGVMNMERFVA